MKIWTSGISIQCILAMFDNYAFRLRSVSGDSVHFLFLTGLRESPQLHSYLASSYMVCSYLNLTCVPVSQMTKQIVKTRGRIVLSM